MNPGPSSARPTREQPVSAAGDTRGNAIVLTSGDLSRTVDRIAHQILERLGDRPFTLLGIPTRGTDLAARLAERISVFSQASCPVGSLDITLYRDDLRRRPPRTLEETHIPPEGVDNRVCVLVDDVLFSGRTVRAALDALRDLGRPAAVQLAVLIDRGHRELPIRADYVGKNIPTSPVDDVAVRLVERDGRDLVELIRA